MSPEEPRVDRAIGPERNCEAVCDADPARAAQSHRIEASGVGGELRSVAARPQIREQLLDGSARTARADRVRGRQIRHQQDHHQHEPEVDLRFEAPLVGAVAEHQREPAEDRFEREEGGEERARDGEREAQRRPRRRLGEPLRERRAGGQRCDNGPRTSRRGRYRVRSLAARGRCRVGWRRRGIPAADLARAAPASPCPDACVEDRSRCDVRGRRALRGAHRAAALGAGVGGANAG